MSETTKAQQPTDIPTALAAPKSRRSVQLVWLIPLIAALIGGWLAVKEVLDKGPVITISFKTAEGLEEGKTKLKYKDVEIGLVKTVNLSEDRTKVIVTADMDKDAKSLMVSDTSFWVVRPRISGGSISGLGTLLSGSYIGVDIGKSKKEQRAFIGLEVPPVIPTDAPGREFVLHSADLGSLDIGSPVFFRRLQVGQITAYAMDKNGGGVTLNVFVNAPYDKFVTPNTRFWQASGVDMSLTANGISVQTQSMVSILVGGLAFETPARSIGMDEAKPNAEFHLADNRADAMKRPDGIVDTRIMVFNESVRGLLPGAPVSFLGIDVGEVVSINTEFDPATKKFTIPVEVHVYPERLSSRRFKGPKTGRMMSDPKANYDALVAQGLRAQLRTGNLLTGQLYIALDFFPDAPKARIDWSTDPVEFPTIQGSLTDLREAATRIMNKLEKIDYEAIGNSLQQTLQGANSVVKKVDKVEFEAIGTDLRQTLQSTTRLMEHLDTQVVPEAKGMVEDARRALVSAEKLLASDSPLLMDTQAAMNEIARAARSVRILADYLEQHPEALISGKKEEGK
jgi:paraquat-inducible protein B